VTGFLGVAAGAGWFALLMVLSLLTIRYANRIAVAWDRWEQRIPGAFGYLYRVQRGWPLRKADGDIITFRTQLIRGVGIVWALMFAVVVIAQVVAALRH
jgi:hypothetical protein